MVDVVLDGVLLEVRNEDLQFGVSFVQSLQQNVVVFQDGHDASSDSQVVSDHVSEYIEVLVGMDGVLLIVPADALD